MARKSNSIITLLLEHNHMGIISTFFSLRSAKEWANTGNLTSRVSWIAPEYLQHFNAITITSAVLISSISEVFLITAMDTNE